MRKETLEIWAPSEQASARLTKMCFKADVPACNAAITRCAGHISATPKNNYALAVPASNALMMTKAVLLLSNATKVCAVLPQKDLLRATSLPL